MSEEQKPAPATEQEKKTETAAEPAISSTTPIPSPDTSSPTPPTEVASTETTEEEEAKKKEAAEQERIKREEEEEKKKKKTLEEAEELKKRKEAVEKKEKELEEKRKALEERKKRIEERKQALNEQKQAATKIGNQASHPELEEKTIVALNEVLNPSTEESASSTTYTILTDSNPTDKKNYSALIMENNGNKHDIAAAIKADHLAIFRSQNEDGTLKMLKAAQLLYGDTLVILPSNEAEKKLFETAADTLKNSSPSLEIIFAENEKDFEEKMAALRNPSAKIGGLPEGPTPKPSAATTNEQDEKIKNDMAELTELAKAVVEEKEEAAAAQELKGSSDTTNDALPPAISNEPSLDEESINFFKECVKNIAVNTDEGKKNTAEIIALLQHKGGSSLLHITEDGTLDFDKAVPENLKKLFVDNFNNAYKNADEKKSYEIKEDETGKLKIKNYETFNKEAITPLIKTQEELEKIAAATKT